MKKIFLVSMILCFCLVSSAQVNFIKGAKIPANKSLLLGTTPVTETTFKAKIDSSRAKALFPLKSEAFQVANGVLGYTAAEVDAKLIFCKNYQFSGAATPADATTYYFGVIVAKAFDSNATYHQDVLPFNCKLIAATIITLASGTPSNETYSVYVRKNNTTDYLLSSSVFNGASTSLPYHYIANGSGLNSTYSSGDKIEIKVVTPTWATNPTSYYLYVDLYFKKL